MTKKWKKPDHDKADILASDVPDVHRRLQHDVVGGRRRFGAALRLAEVGAAAETAEAPGARRRQRRQFPTAAGRRPQMIEIDVERITTEVVMILLMIVNDVNDVVFRVRVDDVFSCCCCCWWWWWWSRRETAVPSIGKMMVVMMMSDERGLEGGMRVVVVGIRGIKGIYIVVEVGGR